MNILVLCTGNSARSILLEAILNSEGAGRVRAHIAGAYWFTASTSFANPAVTIARGLTDTFAGIARDHVAAFVLAQAAGAALAAISLPRLFSAR